MKKVLIILGIILVIAGIGSAMSKKDAAKESEEKAKAAKDAPTVSAGEVFKAYKDNEVSADERFKGKWVKVQGTVSKIGKDIVDDIYVTLDAGDVLFEVQAYFDDSEKSAVAKIAKGQRLTAVCMGEGKALNVLLKKCSVVE